MLNNLTKKCIVKFISFSAGKYPNLKRFVTVTNSDARSRGLQGMAIKVLILIINNLIIPFPYLIAVFLKPPVRSTCPKADIVYVKKKSYIVLPYPNSQLANHKPSLMS